MRKLLLGIAAALVLIIVLAWGTITKPESLDPVQVIISDTTLDKNLVNVEEAFGEFSRAWDMYCTVKNGDPIQHEGLTITKELAKENVDKATQTFNRILKENPNNVYTQELDQRKLDTTECNGD